MVMEGERYKYRGGVDNKKCVISQTVWFVFDKWKEKKG